MSFLTRRYLLGALLAIFVYAMLAYNFQPDYMPRIPVPETVHDFWANLGHQALGPTMQPLVVGPPTASVWDNLRNDTQYITSWISAGWSTSPLPLRASAPRPRRS